MAFTYSDAELDALDVSLSKDRLNRYLRMSRDDRKKAIQFYEMNNIVSESLFGAIRGLEVALRNGYHVALTAAARGREDWYNHFFTELGKWEQDSINRVRETIKKRRIKEDPARMISLLGMGFWCGLTSKTYDASLWVPYLHKAFAHNKIGRRDAFDRLEKIRDVRNRVAHHESILHLNLAQEYKDVLETIGWLCPVTVEWVKHTSTMPTNLAELANMIAQGKTVVVATPAEPKAVAQAVEIPKE